MSDDFTGHDMAQASEDAYARGVQNSMLRATKYERILTERILRDLIAELRDGHHRLDDSCGECETHLWPCPPVRLADRAEARLNKLNGEANE